MLERFVDALLPILGLSIAALAVFGAQVLWILKLVQRQRARELAYRERIAAHVHTLPSAARADG